MNAERFGAIVAAYGASAERWPQAERAAAEAFARTREGTAMLADARALDAALDDTVDAAPTNLKLHGAILASAPKPRAPPWRALAALAACAIIGVAIGAGSADSLTQARAADAAIDLMIGEFG